MNDISLFLSNLDFNLSIVESTAVILSIIYVVLATKQNIYCWTFAFISTTLYVYICYNAQLFAETGLQVFYLIMAVYGYLNWNNSNKKLGINQFSTSKHLIIILIGTICSFLVGYFFSTYTTSKMPIVDSFTTVFSIIATFMLTKKILGNWLYWIIIDFVSIYLYYSRELHLTSLLFFAYGIIAIFGYFAWLNKIKKNA